MLKSIEMLKEAENYFRDVGYPAYAERISKASKAIAEEVEREYIALPKDKNNVPIRLGDRVYTELGSTYAVSRITREDFMGTTTWYVEDFAANYSLGPEDLTHHKPPTIEDVLFELLEKAVGHYAAHTDLAQDVVGDFAKRLQLKEDE